MSASLKYNNSKNNLNSIETQDFIDRIYSNGATKSNYVTNVQSTNSIVSQTSSQNSVKETFKPEKVSSFFHNEGLAKDVLSKAGPASTYEKKDYSYDIGIGGASNQNFKISEITSSSINQDSAPLRVVKPNDEKLFYKQKVKPKKINLKFCSI